MTTDHIERIDLNCIYRFENPHPLIPVRVVAKFYNGVIVGCIDCEDLHSKMILTLDLFMELEPIMTDRL